MSAKDIYIAECAVSDCTSRCVLVVPAIGNKGVSNKSIEAEIGRVSFFLVVVAGLNRFGLFFYSVDFFRLFGFGRNVPCFLGNLALLRICLRRNVVLVGNVCGLLCFGGGLFVGIRLNGNRAVRDFGLCRGCFDWV